MLFLRLARLGGKTYNGCLLDASQMPPRSSQMPSRCLPAQTTHMIPILSSILSLNYPYSHNCSQTIPIAFPYHSHNVPTVSPYDSNLVPIICIRMVFLYYSHIIAIVFPYYVKYVSQMSPICLPYAFQMSLRCLSDILYPNTRICLGSRVEII